ncbi:uncharacterized protein CMU_007630 [Cryptosporidium muris RN66]|uniref:Zinc finger PHD-type domain-containing protein n=1 Tax=Cryptosporidium muris (strain RN66) TaxID=441375 RepID=B6ADI2_CRYMR|nr:uncharacterized protein CMU_007630 [Cryptosporidium muris RN66]EEA06273.1 hypothetical protein, conserved [Cryptosporidium muris RN66]|eukprot:XP_002140622.1 hypothetical protein [Cryptosporidium muris RN66]
MEWVTLENVLQDRGIQYAKHQILDKSASKLKKEINLFCKNINSIDDLIDMNHSQYNKNKLSKRDRIKNFEGNISPHIFSSTLGSIEGVVDINSQRKLHTSILDCIEKGYVSDNIQIVNIIDNSHPVRLATKASSNCYSLIWKGRSLPDSHDVPMVLGEYTGNVVYVGEDDISDESYSFQLTFKDTAFKYPNSVVTGSIPLLNERIISELNLTYKNNKYQPETCENSNILNASGDVLCYSKPYSKVEEIKRTNGLVKKLGARLLLPHDNEYIITADNKCNEMAFLNHYECIISNNCNLRINTQWHSVYIDGWPHILLTTIPGIGIKNGDELSADFGSCWFSKIKRICKRNIIEEFILYRNKYFNYSQSIERGCMNKYQHKKDTNLDFIEKTALKDISDSSNKKCPTLDTKTIIEKYDTYCKPELPYEFCKESGKDICEICQHIVLPKTSKYNLKKFVPKSISYQCFPDIPDNIQSYVVCSGCNRAYHWQCIQRPELTKLSMMFNRWYCFQCIQLALDILPLLIKCIPGIDLNIIKIINDFFSGNIFYSGVVDVNNRLILRSSEQVLRENPGTISFRPSENYIVNQRFIEEDTGLKSLSYLKPCYICYSTIQFSRICSTGIALLCRIYRMHLAPDYDELFNTLQFNQVTDSKSKRNLASISFINGSSVFQPHCEFSNNSKKSLLNTNTGDQFRVKCITERSRKVINSLRLSLYQSENHRSELLLKLESLRSIQDKYFYTITAGNGLIPVICIKLGETVINKIFNGVLYEGVVTRYYPKERLFHIEYSDGDAEDMEYSDFLYTFYNDIKSGRIPFEKILVPTEVNKNSNFQVTEYNFDEINIGGTLRNNSEFFGDRLKIDRGISKYNKSSQNTESHILNVSVDNTSDKHTISKCSILDIIDFFHKVFTKICKLQFLMKGAVRLFEKPCYRYINEPIWCCMEGKYNVKNITATYSIEIITSEIERVNLNLSLRSKISFGSIILKRDIPLKLAFEDLGNPYNCTIDLNNGYTCVSSRTRSNKINNLGNIMECTSESALKWINERIEEICDADELIGANTEINKYESTHETSRNCKGDLKSSTVGTSDLMTSINNLISEEWIKRCNELAQILEPYPPGIKWLSKKCAWKITYKSEDGERRNSKLQVYPSSDTNTVEGLYIKACNILLVQSMPFDSFNYINLEEGSKENTYTAIEHTHKDFMSSTKDLKHSQTIFRSYNFSENKRLLELIREEVDSINPMPKFIIWDEEKLAFKIKFSGHSEQLLFLSDFDFQVDKCINFAVKHLKYISAIKSSKDEIGGNEDLRPINTVSDIEIEHYKKGISYYSSFLDKSGVLSKDIDNVCDKLIEDTDKCNDLAKNSYNLLEKKTKLRRTNLKENIPNTQINGEVVSLKCDKSEYNDMKPIVRASPTPLDPESRARIIEYSKEADLLRPFPHGITWCYRSARFKVRYRRSTDGGWTATSFPPSKFDSVKTALNFAMRKLAMHIDDYKNSITIPKLPDHLV